VVVYSVVERATFKTAEDILNYLWRENFTQEKSVIVVGNKSDLERARTIATSGISHLQSFTYYPYLLRYRYQWYVL
jgi:Rad/Gem-related GTP binding protein 1